MHDDLVDRVQDQRKDKDVPDIVPRLSQQLVPAAWMGENGPQEGGLAFPCIVQSRPDRKEDGHGRLEDQPESHRPVRTTDEILPYASECLFHNSPSRLGTLEWDHGSVSGAIALWRKNAPARGRSWRGPAEAGGLRPALVWTSLRTRAATQTPGLHGNRQQPPIRKVLLAVREDHGEDQTLEHEIHETHNITQDRENQTRVSQRFLFW